MNRDDKILVDETLKNVNPNLAYAEGRETCPLEGCYSQIGKELDTYFSDYALVKNRVKVEVYWLKYLLENIGDSKILIEFDSKKIPDIMTIYEKFSDSSYARVKEIEKETNHDVKATKLFVAEKLEEMGFVGLTSFVNIGCTSEDITNVALATMISGAISEVWIPAAERLTESIYGIAVKYADTVIITHTDGEADTTTTVGKEFIVYKYRLSKALENIKSIKVCAKFNGASGNYAAILTAFPNRNWHRMSKDFIERYLGLEYDCVTSRFENYDYICHIADGIRHFNNILLEFVKYISMEYFKKTDIKVDEIKSNIEKSNKYFMDLSNKLPSMQGDLQEITNIERAFYYSLQGIEQISDDLKKVTVDEEKIAVNPEESWEVLKEPIQTVLCKNGIPYAYKQLEKLTEGKKISKLYIQIFVNSLDVLSELDKNILLELTPTNYIGLVDRIIKDER